MSQSLICASNMKVWLLGVLRDDVFLFEEP